MAQIEQQVFAGEVPRSDPSLLPDAMAQLAVDCRFDSGKLLPMRSTVEFGTVPAGARSFYRHRDEWLSWPVRVSLCTGVTDDDRLYYTGDGVPKMRAGGVVYPLALPAPSAPALAVDGTASGDPRESFYVRTWVTQLGEESGPSAPSAVVKVYPGQARRLSGLTPPPAGRGITKQRLYRSEGSLSGAVLRFVTELPADAGQFTDTLAGTALGETLPTLYYDTPPDGLQGLISLPNGGMAGFAGRELCFCEPYLHYAWPRRYRLKVDADIVALGAIGDRVVVMTKGMPYLASGTTPDSMVLEKLELTLPCINADGVADLGYAVAYPSHDGLVLVDGSGARLATRGLFTPEQWRALSPSTLKAGHMAGLYVASYRSHSHVGEEGGILLLDLTGETPYLSRLSLTAEAFHHSLQDGKLYALSGTRIVQLDADGAARLRAIWRSRVFRFPQPVALSALRLLTEPGLSAEELRRLQEEDARSMESNAQLFAVGLLGGAMADSILGQVAMGGDQLRRSRRAQEGDKVTVSVFADGALVASTSARNAVVRLPSVGRHAQWHFEVASTLRVDGLRLGATAREV